jgi:2-oxoglutarate dehydrogenase E1 component
VEEAASDALRAAMLIRTYRVRGHLAADLDPLGLNNRKLPADLTPEYHGFSGAALDKKVYLGGALGVQWATVNEIVAILRQNYCGKVGLEYMHIADTQERKFLQERMEGADKSIDFTPKARRPFWARWCAVSSTRSSAARSGSAPSASAWMVASP